MKEEKGAIMVEAAFIFPMVLLTVMALIYLGLYKLQEGAILYQVQKVARQSDYVVASPGYQELGRLDAKSFDFVQDPSAAQVTAYYGAYHSKLTHLYREIFGCTWTNKSKMSQYAGNVMKSLYIFMGFDRMNSKVEIKRNFLSNSIKVTTSMEYPVPGVLRYFGWEGNVVILQSASAVSMNPADFIRDVDMAWDGIKALARMMNVDLDSYVGKFKEIVNFL